MFSWRKKQRYNSASISIDCTHTPKNYQSLCREGYQKNVIVYRCINLIVKNLVSIPLLVYDNDQECGKDHPLYELLLNPNEFMNYQNFMTNLVGSYLLSGNAYLYTFVDHEKGEMFPLRSDNLSIQLDQNGHPDHYVYFANNQKMMLSRRLSKGKPSVLHIKSYNPLSEWYGFSPIEAAASAIDQHNAVGKHNLALLQNGGRPSGALMIDEALSDHERRQIRQDIENFYQSHQNAGKILILEGGFRWQELGLSPKNLDFLPGKNVSVKEIATAFGVSPLLVGLTEDASYTNYREARLQLWEDTIIPLLNYFLTSINHWLHNIYPKSLRIDFDLDAIPVLSEKREETWAKLKDCSFLTINEKRQALGYSPVDGGDIIAPTNHIRR